MSTPKPNWYHRMTSRQLLHIIQDAARELEGRDLKGTDRLPVIFPTSLMKASLEFKTGDYLRVPELTTDERKKLMPQRWRIAFIAQPIKEKPPWGIEVYKEVMMGRAEPTLQSPPIDFKAYGAFADGVSREHAILRPTPEGLFIVDNGSMNGTYVNGEPLDPHEERELSDEDTISLANLHLLLRIIEKPEKAMD